MGALDLLVAGITLASRYDTIVTRDKDFRGIPGLRVETY
jgi:predicted nucleic acid-binding protein